MIIAKLIALIPPAFLIVTLSMFVIIIVSGYYTVHFTGILDFSHVNFLQMGFSIVLGVFSLLPYASLAILFSVIGRSLTLPLVGGVGWILIELISFQSLSYFGEIGKSIAQWLPIGINMGLLQLSEAIARVSPPGITTMYPWNRFNVLPTEIAAFAAAGYVIMVITISLVIFYRQDISNN